MTVSERQAIPKFAGDSQFWALVATAVECEGETSLVPLFKALSIRASERNLPITFGGRKSIAWALVCRMFLLYQGRMPAFGRKEYLAMVSGSKRVLRPPHFAKIAFRRIAANISYPSSPGRTMKGSVADTFLANGLSVTEGYEGPSMDALILSQSLADPGITDLCDRIVTPPFGLWDEATAAYGEQRKKFVARKWDDLRFWIFDR